MARKDVAGCKFERITDSAELDKLITILVENQLVWMAEMSYVNSDRGYDYMYSYFSKLSQSQYEKLVTDATSHVKEDFTSLVDMSSLDYAVDIFVNGRINEEEK